MLWQSFRIGQRCKFCNESKSEKRISKFLLNNNINFITQLRIKKCRDIKPLPFDFAIYYDKEKNNLAFLCEFDGFHHFHETRRKNAKEYFQKVKKHDLIKDNFCKLNNINLERISYLEDKKLEDRVKEILVKYKIL
jgi:hypothetical protein